MRITDATFAIIDTESSGLTDNPNAELLEIAVSLCGGMGHVFSSFTTFVRNTAPIPPEAKGVHHIIEDMLTEAPLLAHVVDEVRALIGGAIPVAYNAEHDAKIAPFITSEWLCAFRFAHHMTPEAPSFGLQTLRYYYGFDHLATDGIVMPHRALGDVYTLTPVFFHLIARYRAWAEETCAGDLERLEKALQVETLMNWIKSPYPMLVWPVGPKDAKGKPFAEIDTGLLTWGLRQDFNADFKWNIARELKRRGHA